MDPRNVSDEVLDARMLKRAETERVGVVEFLIDMLEVDRRGLFVKLGYSSMYMYLKRHLKCSDGTASRRCAVLVLIEVFPIALEWLKDGRTNIEILLQLKHVMNDDNHLDLLTRCEGKGKAEVDVVIESIRSPQPEWSWAPAPTTEVVPSLTSETASTATGCEPPSWMDELPPPLEARQPAKPVRRLEVSEDDWELLQDCKFLLSHAMPDAQPIDVVREALQQLKNRLETKKHGAEKPRKVSKKPKDPHSVPMAVAREVYERDQGMCTFVGTTGQRCGSRYKLENHHIDPKGPSTVDNVTLHCRVHNFHRAEVDYGVEYMKRFRTRSDEAREAVTEYG